jgi:hypothetical protein
MWITEFSSRLGSAASRHIIFVSSRRGRVFAVELVSTMVHLMWTASMLLRSQRRHSVHQDACTTWPDGTDSAAFVLASDLDRSIEMSGGPSFRSTRKTCSNRCRS